jgi:hypothetical protein
MIPLIGTISKTAKKVPGGPIVQGVVVLALLLVMYYVLRAVIRGVGNAVETLLDPRVNPEELVDETPTADNTDLTETEEDAFALTAKSIAEGQYNAMKGWGTNETALFNGLLNLNGGQLQAVYEEYGIKEGKNLFEWYADELGSGPLSSLVWYCGTGGLDCEDAQVEGCEAWIDNCYEADFMRSIWQKSGLPITF